MTLAVPRTWVVGEVVTAAYMNAEIRDQFNDLISGWTSYTPEWTGSVSNPSLGNGTIIGRYKTIGKVCTVIVEIVMGTTTTFGSGYWLVSLPLTAANPASTSATFAYLGAARAHSATAWYTGITAVTKNLTRLKVHGDGVSTEWSSSQPHSWSAASTNYFHAQVTYETA